MVNSTTFVPQDVRRSLKKNLKNMLRLVEKRNRFKRGYNSIEKEPFKE